MKKMKCYDCDKEFSSETSEDILNQMHPHYMEVHKEIIQGASEDQKKEWMQKFNNDWESAQEV